MSFFSSTAMSDIPSVSFISLKPAESNKAPSKGRIICGDLLIFNLTRTIVTDRLDRHKERRMKRRGFTLIEVLTCCGIISLLLGMIFPSFYQARKQALSAACMSNLHLLGQAIHNYAAAENNRLPPFAFSDPTGDISLSGHWGGISQGGDPVAFLREGMECVNLWGLAKENYVSPRAMLCPGAAKDLLRLDASYFPCSSRFSTYCLRFPASSMLFNDAPHLANIGGSLLGAYVRQAGGQRVNVSTEYEILPQVRLDRRYRLDAGGQTYDVVNDALLADTFWRRGYQAPAAPMAGLQSFPVQWDWCHDLKFNVLLGNGAVKLVHDDGTVAGNSNSPNQTIAPADSITHAETIWQYFDSH
jgi:prepilin-type N-terminal cleavage/methylation domain-containing protein